MGGTQSCTPCDKPCPPGFDYSETCGYWFWESDVHKCTPQKQSIPDGAVGRGTYSRRDSDCPCPVVGGCGEEVKEAPSCGDSAVEIGVKETCCQKPSLCMYCCTEDFGFSQQRECEDLKKDNFLFILYLYL